MGSWDTSLNYLMQLMKEGKWPTSSMSMSVRMLYFCFGIQTCENLNSKEPKTSKLRGYFALSCLKSSHSAGSHFIWKDTCFWTGLRSGEPRQRSWVWGTPISRTQLWPAIPRWWGIRQGTAHPPAPASHVCPWGHRQHWQSSFKATARRSQPSVYWERVGIAVAARPRRHPSVWIQVCELCALQTAEEVMGTVSGRREWWLGTDEGE